MQFRGRTEGRRIARRSQGFYSPALTRLKTPEQRNGKFPVLQAELQGLAEVLRSHQWAERGAPV